MHRGARAILEILFGWLAENDPVTLMDARGWVAPIAFASIGVTLVVFALGQTVALSKEWADYRTRVGQMSYFDQRRCERVKSYAKFLSLAEPVGLMYFFALDLLLTLYVSPAPPMAVAKLALYLLMAATAAITLIFLICGIRAVRLFP